MQKADNIWTECTCRIVSRPRPKHVRKHRKRSANLIPYLLKPRQACRITSCAELCSRLIQRIEQVAFHPRSFGVREYRVVDRMVDKLLELEKFWCLLKLEHCNPRTRKSRVWVEGRLCSFDQCAPISRLFPEIFDCSV